MDHSPLVSVVVITYNQENFILQTLKSIVHQQGSFRLELVIANDCSTDRTGKIISEFVREYKGNAIIRYTAHAKNLGIVPNLIFALEQCTGDYLALCEGDDYWLDENKLQRQLAFFHQHNDCSMVITNRKVEREDGSWYDERYDTFYKKACFTIPDLVDGFIPGLQTIFAKNNRQLAGFLAAHRDLTHADRYITYFFALHGRVYLLPEVTAVYRHTGAGAWSSNDGLRKLQVKAEQLEDFHRRIGLPLNNTVLAQNHLACWWTTVKYCMKRPRELKKPVNSKWIRKTWGRFPHMNRIKLLWRVIGQ